MTTIYTPYTYLVGWSDRNKYYYGLRYATQRNCLYESGCHPDDLWKTYFTSSNAVKSFREKFGEPDIIQVRKTFSSALAAKLWEHRVLCKLRAATNDKWLNKTYAMVEFDLHAFNTGSKRTNEQRATMSAAQKGRVISAEHASKISKATKGREAWNKGKNIPYKNTAKNWLVYNSANDKSYKVHSLREWCNRHNINYTVFHRNVKKGKPYKNYTAQEIDK